MTLPDRIVRAITASVARMQVRTRHGDEFDPVVIMHPALYPNATKIGSVTIARNRIVPILSIYVINVGAVKITTLPFEFERVEPLVEPLDKRFSVWRMTSPSFLRTTSPSYIMTGA